MDTSTDFVFSDLYGSLLKRKAAGFLKGETLRYRLQILTIAELLGGKKLEYPAHRVETFAKAERKTKTAQEHLF